MSFFLDKKLFISIAVIIWVLFGQIVTVFAYNPSEKGQLAHETPKQLQDIGIDERLGGQLNLSLPFMSDDGKPVTLSSYFHSDRPVLLTMVYYECPSLCNFHLNGVTDALKQMEWTAGKEFEVVAVSMDHRETPEMASKKKASYLKEYGRLDATEGWHFLTGTEEHVGALAQQIGFKFKWDEETQQYAHASAAVLVTPEGKISRYLYGVEFAPKTLRFGLLEASNGKIGGIVDQLVLFCFQFDPNKNKYTIYAYNIMRLGGALAVVILALFFVPIWLKERRKQKSVPSS